MSRTERREYLVGVLTALVIVLILLVAAQANRRRIEGDAKVFHLSAEFARVDGLHVGSPVRIAGLPVGTVTAMKLQDNFRALLTFQFNHVEPLPEDTSASVQTDGLFGTKFVELEPGGSDEMLKSGGRIGYTQDSIIIEDLITRIVNQAKAARDQAATQAVPKANP